ncbi:MAG: helix-turn-helix transcriptional regulator [Hyphomicrobiaceae bacterium]
MDESDLYDQLGLLVRQHRERLDMNQSTLAEAIALSRASVANIEAGRQQVALHQVYRLAAALGVDVTTLLPGATGKPPNSRKPKIEGLVSLSPQEEADVARVYAAGAPPKLRRKR